MYAVDDKFMFRISLHTPTRLFNVSIVLTVPKGVECYLYPACSGAVLGLWICWSARKWDRRRAQKEQLCSKFCWTWASLGSF